MICCADDNGRKLADNEMITMTMIIIITECFNSLSVQETRTVINRVLLLYLEG